MKSIFAILFIPALVYALGSKNKEWKTFKSDLGYEIKYPECMKISAGHADDMDKKNETLDSIAIMVEVGSCVFTHNGNGISIDLSYPLEHKRSFQEQIKMMERAIVLNKRGGNNSNIYQKAIGDEFQTVRLADSFKQIVWEFHKPCGKDYFRISYSTEANKDADPKLIEAIKKGDPSFPAIQQSIVDTFKCTRKDGK